MAPPDRPEPHPSESVLVGEAMNGDSTALDELLRRHQSRLFAICRRMCGNDADAHDACQNAMIAICRGISRFDQRSQFSTWAYRITTNACLDELRRRARRPVAVPELPSDSELHARDGHDTAIADRLMIDEALGQLPEEFRSPLVLRDLCDFDYAEIAEVLQIPPGTVRSRISRARAALRRQIGNHDPAGQRPSSQP